MFDAFQTLLVFDAFHIYNIIVLPSVPMLDITGGLVLTLIVFCRLLFQTLIRAPKASVYSGCKFNLATLWSVQLNWSDMASSQCQQCAMTRPTLFNSISSIRFDSIWFDLIQFNSIQFFDIIVALLNSSIFRIHLFGVMAHKNIWIW